MHTGTCIHTSIHTVATMPVWLSEAAGDHYGVLMSRHSWRRRTSISQSKACKFIFEERSSQSHESSHEFRVFDEYPWRVFSSQFSVQVITKSLSHKSLNLGRSIRVGHDHHDGSVYQVSIPSMRSMRDGFIFSSRGPLQSLNDLDYGQITSIYGYGHGHG